MQRAEGHGDIVARPNGDESLVASARRFGPVKTGKAETVQEL
jgi:hypothetical protein